MDKLHVVLVGIEYEGHLGMIARLCQNFGVEGLILVKPAIEITEEAKRWSMHSREFLESAEIVGSLDEIKDRFDCIVGTTAKTANQYNINRSYLLPWEIQKTKKMALVFGRESSGLTNDELERCDAVVFIPTSPKYRSLNISNAVTVLLYEFYKKEGDARIADKKIRKQLYSSWGEIVEKLGFENDKATIKKSLFRRVIEKSQLNSREGYGIAGVFSRILKRIKT